MNTRVFDSHVDEVIMVPKVVSTGESKGMRVFSIQFKGCKEHKVQGYLKGDLTLNREGDKLKRKTMLKITYTGENIRIPSKPKSLCVGIVEMKVVALAETSREVWYTFENTRNWKKTRLDDEDTWSISCYYVDYWADKTIPTCR